MVDVRRPGSLGADISESRLITFAENQIADGTEWDVDLDSMFAMLHKNVDR